MVKPFLRFPPQKEKLPPKHENRDLCQKLNSYNWFGGNRLGQDVRDDLGFVSDFQE